MLVVVVAVFRVAVTIVHEIDVVAVLDGLVPATGTVTVVVGPRDHVHVVERAFVVMPLVAVVRVTVVQVIDMPFVFDRDVPAIRSVHVRVPFMCGAVGGHLQPFARSWWTCLANPIIDISR